MTSLSQVNFPTSSLITAFDVLCCHICTVIHGKGTIPFPVNSACLMTTACLVNGLHISFPKHYSERFMLSLCSITLLLAQHWAPKRTEETLMSLLTLTPLPTTGIQVVGIKALWLFQFVQYLSNIHDLQQKIECSQWRIQIPSRSGFHVILSCLYLFMLETNQLIWKIQS